MILGMIILFVHGVRTLSWLLWQQQQNFVVRERPSNRTIVCKHPAFGWLVIVGLIDFELEEVKPP